jgi:hypothetical protein
VGETLVMARVTKQSVHNLDMAPGREILVLIKSVALDRHNLRLPTGASNYCPDPMHDAR